MDVEQRARELLADEFSRMGGVSAKYVEEVRKGIVGPWDRAAIRAIIAALTPSDGHVVVTRNEAGQAVAVTRQDDEGRILSVIAEFEAPQGYVPMDRGPWIVHNDGEAVISSDFTHDVWLRLTGDFCPDSRKLYAEWLASVLNATSPKVKP